MARRRYISTEISTDPKVVKLAGRGGYLAVLLYTWMIPHAEDDGTITADPEELLLKVFPGFREVSTEDVEEYLRAMNDVGLIALSDGKAYFPYESFYKYQTYVSTKNRRDFDPVSDAEAGQTAEERRKTPENTVSDGENAVRDAETAVSSGDIAVSGGENAVSLSLSLSPSLTPKNIKDMSTGGADGPAGEVHESDYQDVCEVPKIREVDQKQGTPPVQEVHEADPPKSRSAGGRKDYSHEFEEWWEKYPRKDAKKEALAKYAAARKRGVLKEDLFKARDNYVRHLRASGTERQFIMQAKTFLGPNERWRDWLKGPPSAGRSAEPAKAVDFDAERAEIEELFGGDQREWWAWRKAGKPEIGKWRSLRSAGEIECC